MGFEASLGLTSNLGYGETMSQKRPFFSLFLSFLCPIIIYQEVAVEFKVGSEYIVSYLECQQLLGSVGQF